MQNDVARGHAADEGHAGRAQRDARAARARRGARLRGVHGALRRLLPREPADPRRAARAHGPAHGGHAGDAELDDARAAGAAPGARPSSCSRTWTCAGRWTSSAQNLQQHVPADGLGPALRLQRPGPAGLRRGGAADAASSATSTSSRTCCAARPTRARWPRSTSTGSATCWATTPPAALERLAELAKMLEEAGLIEQQGGPLELTPKGIRTIGSERARATCSPSSAKDKMGQHELERIGVGPRARRTTPSPTSSATRSTSTSQRTIRNAMRRTGRRHAGAAHARRLRDRAHRAPHAVVARC